MAPTPLMPAAGEPEQPKKFLRTLESDMQAVKQGGQPGFAQVREAPAPAAPPLPPSPPPQAQAPRPAVTIPAALRPPARPAPAPPVPAAPARPIVAVPPPPPPPPLPPPAPAQPAISPPRAPELAPLETYSGDFSKRVEDTHASRLSILAAQQDSAAGAPSAPAPARTNARTLLLYVLPGIALFLIGFGGAAFAYVRFVKHAQPIALAPAPVLPIFVDEQATVSGTGAALAASIEQAAAAPELGSDRIRALSLPAGATTTVFQALMPPAPDVLLRNIAVPGSMAGAVNTGTGASVFFILAVSDYSLSFSGMLKWQPTMPQDLAALFPGAAGPYTGFKDEVVANHDAHAYTNAAGATTLIYGYWNQNTLLIARDEDAFSALIERLSTSRSR